jgi:hypothetical protein
MPERQALDEQKPSRPTNAQSRLGDPSHALSADVVFSFFFANNPTRQRAWR